MVSDIISQNGMLFQKITVLICFFSRISVTILMINKQHVFLFSVFIVMVTWAYRCSDEMTCLIDRGGSGGDADFPRENYIGHWSFMWDQKHPLSMVFYMNIMLLQRHLLESPPLKVGVCETSYKVWESAGRTKIGHPGTCGTTLLIWNQAAASWMMWFCAP